MAAGPLRQQRALPLGEPRRPLQRPRLRSPARVCVSYRPSLPARRKSPGRAGSDGAGKARGLRGARSASAAARPQLPAGRLGDGAPDGRGGAASRRSLDLHPACGAVSAAWPQTPPTRYPLPAAHHVRRGGFPGLCFQVHSGSLLQTSDKVLVYLTLNFLKKLAATPAGRARAIGRGWGPTLGENVWVWHLTGHGPSSLRTPPGLHPAADIVGTWRPQGHTGVCAGPRASWQVLSTGRTQRLDSWSWLAGETVAEAEAVGPPDPSGVRLSLLFSTEAWPRLALSPSGEFLL